MAGGSVKLSIYSTFKDDGTKKAEQAIQRFAKKYGKLDKETNTYKLDAATEALLAQSVAADQAAARWQGYSEKLGAAGAALTKYVSAEAGAAIAASVKLASDYEDSFAKVKTIMDKSAEAPAEMSREILDLSTSTGRAATELAEATYQAISAGVATEKAVEFTGQAASLARAGFTDTATAVDTLTTIINAYGMSADEAALISDKLVQTQNRGKTTVAELASSMGQVIPTAAAYGVGLDNLNTAYVQLTKQGINTANATTYINGMLTELANEGSTVSKVLKEQTGKSFSELNAEGMSLGDVMGVLKDSVDGDSTAFANMWGNVRAGKGALAIANAGAAEFNAELAAMGAASGNVASALEDLQTPSAKAAKAINAVKNTGIELGQEFLGALAPALESASQAAQALYRDFSNMDEGSKQAVASMLAVAAAAGPMLLGASKVAAGISSALSAVGSLTAKLATMSAGSGMAARAASALGTTVGGPVLVGVIAATVVLAEFAMLAHDSAKRSDELAGAQKRLTAAVTTGAPSIAGATADLSGYGQAAQRARVDIDAVTRSQSELADKIAEHNASAQGEINRLEGARAVLAQYMNQTGLTAQQQGQLRAAIDYVNEACGTQYQVVDASAGKVADETGAIVENTGAIEDNIRARQMQVRAEALSDTLGDLYKQQADDVAAVASATRDYKSAMAELAEAESAGVTGERWQVLADNVSAADRNLRVAKDNLKAADDAVAATESRLGALQAAEAGAADSAGALARANVNITESLGDQGKIDAFCAHLDQAGVSVGQFNSMSQEKLRELALAYDGTFESVVAAAARIESELPPPVSEGTQAAVDAVRAASPAMGAAAQGAANAAVTAFGRLPGAVGPKGEEASRSLARGISAGTGDVQASADAVRASAESMGNIDTFQSGYHAALNFAHGVTAGQAEATRAATAVANAVAAILKHSIARRGPLHEGGRGEALWGEHAVENYARGMLRRVSSVRRASVAAASAQAAAMTAAPARGWAAPAAQGAATVRLSPADIREIGRAAAQAAPRVSYRAGDVTVEAQMSADGGLDELSRQFKMAAREAGLGR